MPSLSDIFKGRKSCRGFRDQALTKEQLNELFTMAQQAPSWCNIQPWNVIVTSPPETKALSQRIVDHAKQHPSSPDIDFPGPYPEPYNARRKGCGIALYQSMGIERGDTEGRKRAWLRNYECFDAPHLAIVTRDKRLGEYATLDIGVWLGYFLVAAESMGIATCPMASIAEYPGPIRDALNIGDDQVILLGLVMGYEDPSVAANKATTTREDIQRNITFR